MFLNLNRKAPFVSLPMAKAENELANDPSIRLIDVRTAEEYRQGHIPGSVNIPLNEISDIIRLIPDRDARLFVYCLSGARSQQACARLAQLGYTDVSNIGGITQWRGKTERTMGG